MVTLQIEVPEQAPPHPPKAKFDAGDALRVTGVLSVKSNVQLEVQLKPAGELVTVPLPVMFTVRVFLPGWLKLAITV